MSNIIDLAKKLKALADRGVGGEKANAVDLLAKHCQKHNLTLEELFEDKKSHHTYTIRDDQKNLFYQILKNVGSSIGIWKIKSKYQKEMAGNVEIECTDAQFIEFDAKWAIYSKLYDEEQEIFYSAFIQANHLYCEGKPDTEPTVEEKRNARRVLEMAQSIKTQAYRKQLTQ